MGRKSHTWAPLSNIDNIEKEGLYYPYQYRDALYVIGNANIIRILL
jgi:hypothetical protein